MKRIVIIVILLVTVQLSYSQKKGSLYLEYNKEMSIRNGVDEINITFSVASNDPVINTYNFKVKNMAKDFSLLKFEEIKDTISDKELKTIKLKTIKDLYDTSPCNLHIAFSELKHIYLIKKEVTIYYKYELIYWSTQRGWQSVKTN